MLRQLLNRGLQVVIGKEVQRTSLFRAAVSYELSGASLSRPAAPHMRWTYHDLTTVHSATQFGMLSLGPRQYNSRPYPYRKFKCNNTELFLKRPESRRLHSEAEAQAPTGRARKLEEEAKLKAAKPAGNQPQAAPEATATASTRKEANKLKVEEKKRTVREKSRARARAKTQEEIEKLKALVAKARARAEEDFRAMEKEQAALAKDKGKEVLAKERKKDKEALAKEKDKLAKERAKERLAREKAREKAREQIAKAKARAKAKESARIKGPPRAVGFFIKEQFANGSMPSASTSERLTAFVQQYKELPEAEKQKYHERAMAAKAEVDKLRDERSKAWHARHALGPFQMFMMENFASIRAANPDLSSPECMTKAAEAFRSLSAEAKQKYVDMSEADRRAKGLRSLAESSSIETSTPTKAVSAAA